MKAVVQEALPIVADALRAASAAVFVVKPNGAGEALAVCGETRRGFPYPALDLGDPLLRRMAKHPRVVEITDCDRLQPALLAVLCPSRRV